MGDRFGRPAFASNEKRLRFFVNGLKCCLGVKHKGRTRESPRLRWREGFTWAAKPRVKSSL